MKAEGTAFSRGAQGLGALLEKIWVMNRVGNLGARKGDIGGADRHRPRDLCGHRSDGRPGCQCAGDVDAHSPVVHCARAQKSSQRDDVRQTVVRSVLPETRVKLRKVVVKVRVGGMRYAICDELGGEGTGADSRVRVRFCCRIDARLPEAAMASEVHV